METLLTAIILWLSANFELPANYEYPRIELASNSTMRTLYYQNFLLGNRPGIDATDNKAPDAPRATELVAVYSNASKTIYLPQGWTGKTPAELSILVHEMVHHLRNVGGLKYECPQARERLAFVAQERWLRMYGTDLEKEFSIDPFSLLVLSNCGY
jgi:hypothetical protein